LRLQSLGNCEWLLLQTKVRRVHTLTISRVSIYLKNLKKIAPKLFNASTFFEELYRNRDFDKIKHMSNKTVGAATEDLLKIYHKKIASKAIFTRKLIHYHCVAG